MSYTINKRVQGDFDGVVDRTIQALDEEGFGVLTDIDVQQTIAERLGEDIRQYRILGACNPSLAHEALEHEPRLGVLLPCNVVVAETDDGGIEVSAVDPSALLSLVDNPELDEVADEVRQRFERALATLPQD